MPVLEGARLALITIDGHHPGAWLAADNAPFPSGRESRATKAAKRGVVHYHQHLVTRPGDGKKIAKQGISARRHIIVKANGTGRWGG